MGQITEVRRKVTRNRLEYGLPFHEYQAFPAMNASTMKAAFRGRSGKSLSMKHLRHAYENPREDTDDMLFGRALHCLMFERHEFEAKYCAYDGVRNEKHAAYQEFLESHQGMEILRATGRNSMEEAVAAVVAFTREPQEAVRKLIRAGRAEVSLFAEVEGIQCKARLDWLSASDGSIVDLKTTVEVAEQAFGQQFFGYGYDLQLGFYRYLYERLKGKRLPVKVIALEKTQPFDTVVYSVPEEVLERGQAKALEVLRRIGECLDSGRWPGVSTEEIPLFVPNYAMEEEADLVQWEE